MMVKAPGSSFAKVKPPSNIGWSSKRKFARAQTTDVSKRGRSWPEMKKLSWCSESLSAQKRAEARVKHRVQENIRKRSFSQNSMGQGWYPLENQENT